MLPTFTAGENGAVDCGLVIRNCGACACTTAGARITAAAAINRRIVFSLGERRKRYSVIGCRYSANRLHLRSSIFHRRPSEKLVQQRMKMMHPDFAQRRISAPV